MEHASTEAVLPVLDGRCGLFCVLRMLARMCTPCRVCVDKHHSKHVLQALRAFVTQRRRQLELPCMARQSQHQASQAGPGGVHVGHG
jgi:hypothetical protein